VGLERLHDARSAALPNHGATIALVYNWWSLFTRLAIPEKHAEAITSRPLLLNAVGK
jgi:hypothetical protein